MGKPETQVPEPILLKKTEEIRLNHLEIENLRQKLAEAQGELQACHRAYQTRQPILQGLREEVMEFQTQIRRQAVRIEELESERKEIEPRLQALGKFIQEMEGLINKPFLVKDKPNGKEHPAA
jgi:chromosome segregation ATPase